MTKKVEFKIPKGFNVPEGTESGDQFQEMATFQVKPNGTMCLVAIGEHKMPGYQKEDDYEEPSPMSSMQDKTSTRYGQAMGGMSPSSSY